MKFFLIGALALINSVVANAQATILKASSLNQMMDLILNDSVTYFKGEENKGVYGEIYNVATLPSMGEYSLNIIESPKQTFPWSFFVAIPSTKAITYSRIKAELRLLIKSNSLKYKMRVKEDYENGILALGDGVIIVQALYSQAEKKTTISVYRQESY